MARYYAPNVGNVINWKRVWLTVLIAYIVGIPLVTYVAWILLGKP